MRHLILVILTLSVLLPISAQAYDVLVLQSRRGPAYEEVQHGLSKLQNSKRILVMSDYDELDVARILREEQPRLILAIGDAALTATRQVRNTPVLAVLTVNISSPGALSPNMTGISMFVSPNHYMTMFQHMNVRRVGVVHNPAKSGWYLAQARTAARQAGIQLVVREVSSPHEVIDRLSRMEGKIDALWMLPDATSITSETTEAYFLFGLKNAVPVVAFSEIYLGLGAAAVCDIDRTELGRQAADMAEAILGGTLFSETDAFNFPRRVKLKTNPSVLKHLNLSDRLKFNP